MNNIKLLALVAVVFSFGCADSGGGSGSSGVGIIGNLESANWSTSCLSRSSGGYIKSTAQMVSGTFTIAYYYYSDSSCASLSVIATETGTYTATDMNTDGDGTLDKTLGNLLVTPKSTSTVNSYNSSTVCGYSDWALDTTKSVLGRTCGTSTYPLAGAMQYDIYRIIQLSEDPFSAGDLKFGAPTSGHDGSSSSQRYDTLDSSLIYEN